MIILVFQQWISIIFSLGDVSPYLAKDKEYNYYLNVCGKVAGGFCMDKDVSSCQVKSEKSQPKVAGRFTNQTLRLVLVQKCKYVSFGNKICDIAQKYLVSY